MDYPHRVAIYAPPAADDDAFDNAEPGWTLRATGVSADCQPMKGAVQQAAAGRKVDAFWAGFIPSGISAEVDDGFEILSGPGAPMRFRIASVGPQGDDWDTELVLEKTEEPFA